MADLQTDTDGDPRLTTAQAAQHMGKTYRQFTAYASFHELPREGKGRQTRYRLSVLDEHAARLRGEMVKAEKAEVASADPNAALVAYMADRDAQVERLARELGEAQAEARLWRQRWEERERQEKQTPWWRRLSGRRSP